MTGYNCSSSDSLLLDMVCNKPQNVLLVEYLLLTSGEKHFQVIMCGVSFRFDLRFKSSKKPFSASTNHLIISQLLGRNGIIGFAVSQRSNCQSGGNWSWQI